MSAGSDIFSVLGQLQGRQQQLPPQFAATGNQPIRRFQLEQLRMVQPNMQRLGLGALAGPAQMGIQWLTGVLGQRTGMTMTPEGRTFGSYMRAMRQRQDLDELARLSNQTDFNRIRSVVSAFTEAAYRGEDPDRVGALTNAITRDYIGLMDTGVGQMLGLEDYMAPGGLSSSFARRMYVAGMGRRTAPGRMGLSAEEVMDITRQLERRFRITEVVGDAPDIEREDVGFTRGFNMREFGEMAMEMGQRGILDITRRKDQMMRQFRDMAGALDALKDLLGRPDAPIPELMQTLDDMFGGGGLRTIPAARLERMVRQAQSLGRTLGLSNQALQQVMQGATLQAQGMGMQGELGAISALRAMPMAAAAQQITEEEAGRPTGRVRLGMMSPRERMQRVQETFLRTTGSDFSKRLAAMMRMRRMAGGQLSGTMEDVAQKIERGERLTMGPGGETGWLLENLQPGKFRERMGEYGFDPQTFQRIMGNELALQEEMANYNFAIPNLQGLREETLQRLGTRMEGSTLVSRALGITRETPEEERGRRSQAFVARMLEAERTPEGLRQAVLEDKRIRGNIARIAEEEGISQQQVGKMIAEQLRSTGRSVLDRKLFGVRSFEGAQSLLSVDAMNRMAAVRQETESEAALSASMARAGFGQARGGVGGMVQNFLRALAEGGPEADYEYLAAKTLGGVPTERLRAVMEDEDVKEQIEKMQDLRASLEELNESIQEASGRDREILEAQRGETEAKLAGVREELKDLRVFLRPRETQMVTEHAARLLGWEAALETEDKGELARVMKEMRKGVPSTQAMMKTTQHMTEENRKKYFKTVGRITDVLSNIDISDPEGVRTALEAAQSLYGELHKLEKEVVGRTISEEKQILKKKKEREAKRKEELETDARIRQERDKDLADEKKDLDDETTPKKISGGPTEIVRRGETINRNTGIRQDEYEARLQTFLLPSQLA